nr:TRAP transporter small permease subunit [uncultured Halomonas sp.]
MRASLPTPLAWIDAFTERLGKALTWLVLIMMLTEFTIVVLRYLFNVSNTPMQESVMYLHATVFLLAAAYTLKHDGHVRVDIFYRGMSVKKKAWIDLLGTVFLLLPIMVFVVMASLGYVEKSWRILEGSPESGGLPGVFLLKTLIPLFAVLMSLQGLVEVTRNLLIIRGHPAVDDDQDQPEEYV